jgi:hypothetical protein
MRAEQSAKSARARLARMKSKYENPNFKSIGAQALGGALPAYLDRVPMLPTQIAGIPTEGLIGAGLIIASTQMKNNKDIFENLGSGMVAVTAYKLALDYSQGE